MLYGSGAVLAERRVPEPVIGWADDFRRDELASDVKVERKLHARVLQCVVANVRQSGGERETVTSLVVEVIDPAAGPYR